MENQKKEVRDININIRISKAEKAEIEKRADKEDRSVSDYIRLAALGKI